MAAAVADMADSDRFNAMRRAIVQSGAYRLAHQDEELLSGEDLRPLRLQLELLKPERALRAQGIRSTVVVFGSARLTSPEEARTRLLHIERQRAERPDSANLAREHDDARRACAHSRYYEEARRFSEIVSRRFQQEGRRDFVVVTGGGPGIMEAANRGAHDAGARSIGLNISLPREQEPNPFITPDLAFRFRYFALRKMHFLLRAKALVVFPGGYGTLDELFEVLTLVQTGNVPRLPIVLVGRDFWSRAIDFEYLQNEGFIDSEDVQLFTRVDAADEAVAVIQSFYGGRPPAPGGELD
jgi:uncharacterized protein (TIGR00730 family)